MRRKIPSLQALACFEAAARHGSYTRAGQELALTQSAVSRQVAGLEAYLGVALFQRGRHGMALSAAGRNYVAQVAPRLQALERDTLETMARKGAGGSVQLACVPTLAARWLIPRLTQFAQTRPEILIHVDSRTTPFLFADSPYDAALYAASNAQMARWAGTTAVPLMEESVIAVAAPERLGGVQALDTQALLTQPLIQQSTRPHAWREWFESIPQEPAMDNPSALLAGPRYELFSMAAAAAASGAGVALVPRLLVEAELSRGELVQAHSHVLSGRRRYYLVKPAAAEPNPALQAFQDWLMRQ